jgi:hypothetical protein
VQRLSKGVVLLVDPWPPPHSGGDVGQSLSAMRAACHRLPLSVRTDPARLRAGGRVRLRRGGDATLAGTAAELATGRALGGHGAALLCAGAPIHANPSELFASGRWRFRSLSARPALAGGPTRRAPTLARGAGIAAQAAGVAGHAALGTDVRATGQRSDGAGGAGAKLVMASPEAFYGKCVLFAGAAGRRTVS